MKRTVISAVAATLLAASFSVSAENVYFYNKDNKLVYLTDISNISRIAYEDTKLVVYGEEDAVLLSKDLEAVSYASDENTCLPQVRVVKLLPKMVVLDWGKYTKGSGVGTAAKTDETRVWKFELAYTKDGAYLHTNTPGEGTWFQNAMFWGDNRTVYANLRPNTEYCFRLLQKQAGVDKNLENDMVYFTFKTPEEPALPENTVLYNDFDHWNIKGSMIYRAFGMAYTNAQVSANLDPDDEEALAKISGTGAPNVTMDPLFDVRNNTSHALHYSKCPKVWEHFYETDKYGYDNISDLDAYDGWSNYFARESSGAALLGGATTKGAWLGTPRLKALGETPADITFTTHTCAYMESYHSWGTDALYHYIIVDGPGTIVDAGATAATDEEIEAIAAEPNTDKQVLVKMNSNMAADKTPLNDWNLTTEHVIKIEGATQDTRIKIMNLKDLSKLPHARLCVDDVLVTKD